MEPLPQIFDRYRSDKNTSFHNYCRQYDRLVQEYRGKPIRLLEIGIFKGESLKIWREVFPNASTIVGVDITPGCKEYEDISRNIFVQIGNATNPEIIQLLQSQYGPFDIIIDDGSHVNRDVIQSFELLFPLLNNNGLYIIEDTICYKSQPFLDIKYPHHIDYFTKFIPFLNQWRHDSTSGVKDHCVDPFKIQKKTTNVMEYSIDKIEFGCSYIGVFKLVREHWVP
jgi:hypothetical protein